MKKVFSGILAGPDLTPAASVARQFFGKLPLNFLRDRDYALFQEHLDLKELGGSTQQLRGILASADASPEIQKFSWY